MLDCDICWSEYCPICGYHVRTERGGCPRGYSLFCMCKRVIVDVVSGQ